MSWACRAAAAAAPRLARSGAPGRAACEPRLTAALAALRLATSKRTLSSEVAPELLPQVPAAPTLRPYQEECVEECLLNLAAGVSRIGVSSPTGSGKTTMFTSLLARLPPLPNAYGGVGSRVLILVSSIELALQTAAVVSAAHPELLVELEQGAKFKASGAADVTVATYQTLHRSPARLDKFDPAGFKGVIVDEAHHAAAPAYRSVLAHFDPAVGEDAAERAAPGVPEAARLRPTTPVPIIGFSATFARHDGLALGKVFDRIVFHKDFLEMIAEEWLCPVRFTAVRATIDFSAVRLSTASGDFTPTSLANVVNTPAVNRLIVRSWLDRAAARRSTIVFCVNVAHVEALTAEFREAGIDARFLHGGTAMRERRSLLEDFRAGVFPVLVNCAILTEGADVPAIDCVLLARPTRSRNLFSQMIGRGMRLSPKTGKKDCMVLDLVGNAERGVVCTPTLFGLDPESIDDATLDEMQDRAATDEASEPAGGMTGEVPDPTAVTYEEWGPAELQRAMLSRTRGILERMTPNAWVDCGDDMYVLELPKNGYVRIERDGPYAETGARADGGPADGWLGNYFAPNDAAEAAALQPFSRGRFGHTRKKAAPYRRPRLVLHVESLEQALRGCDTFANGRAGRGFGGASMLARNAPWRFRPASESQRALVERRLGLDKMRAAAGADDEQASPLPALTKGQASMVLTRLRCGAKARWEREASAHNREVRAQRKEEERRARETVSVGPLSR